MSVQMVSYFRDDIDSALKNEVDGVANKLLSILNRDEIYNQICLSNQPGKSSHDIQNCFLTEALELGFTSEAKGLFKDATNQLLRPDYYLPIKDTGIILEVERGKVTINNMDLLDFWKCHLCEKANFLFLMVPQELRQNRDMSPRKEFNTVYKRLASFFESDRYTNVWGLVVFGY
ncbi:MAG: hypothetical protein M9899_10125 [Bdellovibrionaceae bacterium]|nr:hypothetical protein [Pseudobdellovibrionaceae bacterium]